MSDEWFYEPGRGRRSRGSSLPLLIIIILIIGNFVTAYYFVNRSNENLVKLNQEIETLNQELETLRFQLQSASLEISAIRDSIQINGPWNASRGLELTQIYNQTRMSVVLIIVRTLFESGQGSGFVYDDKGRIITNNHVVEGAEEITVTFIDGTIVPATLVGTDPYSDLAVIDVDVASYLLKPVTLGDSSKLLVGERVIALGNPFGLADTMTAGIVSAVGRQMDAPGRYAIVDVVQTDAAINPGNSGGPLLNMEGDVVGMNTAILSETRQFSGIGFAIPSDTIKREAPYLIENGEYIHPYIGISGPPSGLTPNINKEMGLDESTRGALITEVVSSGPADQAGLRGGIREENIDGVVLKIGGDVIIGVDGLTVKVFNDLVVYLERNKRPGDTVTFTIIRDKSVMEIDVVLGERPPP